MEFLTPSDRLREVYDCFKDDELRVHSGVLGVKKLWHVPYRLTVKRVVGKTRQKLFIFRSQFIDFFVSSVYRFIIVKYLMSLEDLFDNILGFQQSIFRRWIVVFFSVSLFFSIVCWIVLFVVELFFFQFSGTNFLSWREPDVLYKKQCSWWNKKVEKPTHTSRTWTRTEYRLYRGRSSFRHRVVSRESLTPRSQGGIGVLSLVVLCGILDLLSKVPVETDVGWEE